MSELEGVISMIVTLFKADTITKGDIVDTVFQLTALRDDVMDELSANLSATNEMVKISKSTKMNCALLSSRIAEIEHGSPRQ